MTDQADKTRTKLLKRLKKTLADNNPCADIYPPSDKSRPENKLIPSSKLNHDGEYQNNDISGGSNKTVSPFGHPLGTVGPNLIPLLEEEITKTGGAFYLAREKEEVAQYLITLTKRVNARTIIRDNSGLLQNLKLDTVLNKEGLQVIIDHLRDRPSEETEKIKTSWRQQTKETSLGITSIDYILADTGTVVIKSRPGLSRTLSLVPSIHVAIGEERQILPNLEELFRQKAYLKSSSLFIFITGPSRTADIEQTLTIGVHGPIEFHLILLASK